MVNLTGQMVLLTTDDPVNGVVIAEDDDMLSKIMLTLVKLKLEKEELSETNSELEKEKEELARNGRRLVRELATAHTIIDSLKKRIQN